MSFIRWSGVTEPHFISMWCSWGAYEPFHQHVLITTLQKAAPPRHAYKHTGLTTAYTTNEVKITSRNQSVQSPEPQTAHAPRGTDQTRTNSHGLRGSRSLVWWQGWITGPHLDVANPSAILRYSAGLMGNAANGKCLALKMCWEEKGDREPRSRINSQVCRCM